ncbi:MAG TPA: aminoacetone oxidase family FAD-binding enzyme [Gemmatimonadales bacterium]|nr:aminoacetone oxidase family FAD-binding enzyme [Gemmatimonadales bacterium]
MSPGRADVAVVGAGAAGLLAAAFAAGDGRRTVLLERTKDGGRKILISGGGRCNILPSEVEPEWFVTDSSPHSLRNILRSWPLAAQRRFFEEDLGIPLALEAESGKLFPVTNRARDVRDRLVAHARERGAELRFGSALTGLERTGDGWLLRLEGGEAMASRTVIIATGGLSVPNTGSDGTGLSLLEELGHQVHPTYPALTPLTSNVTRWTELSGVSLDALLTAPPESPAYSRRQGLLFTHRGYSGPAVLNISHLFTRPRAGSPPSLLAQWGPLDRAAWGAELGAGGRAQVGTVIRRHLPERLMLALAETAGVPADRTLAQLRREEREALTTALTALPLPVTGSEGYRKAEVTGGGVALSEIDPVTMESRRAPGLFLCGEVLDAFGPIGGFNFLWAWATGRAAGRGARHHLTT